jgi:hypothetical protein
MTFCGELRKSYKMLLSGRTLFESNVFPLGDKFLRGKFLGHLSLRLRMIWGNKTKKAPPLTRRRPDGTLTLNPDWVPFHLSQVQVKAPIAAGLLFCPDQYNTVSGEITARTPRFKSPPDPASPAAKAPR